MNLVHKNTLAKKKFISALPEESSIEVSIEVSKELEAASKDVLFPKKHKAAKKFISRAKL